MRRSRGLSTGSREVDQLAIMGVSFGAEAALITAALDERVTTVVAFAPTSVVWAGYDEQEHRWTSHWTWKGQVVPFVPVERPGTPPSSSPPSYLPVYRHSLRVATDDQRERATIRVEKIPEVLLVSGGDDQVWPSGEFADAIVARRASVGLDTRHVHLPEAGHRAVLPGEAAPTEGAAMARGGNRAADAELGDLAWPQIREVLNLS